MPGASRRHEHDGAGAVAEQHARAAIVPVEDARIDLGADDQRVARHAAARPSGRRARARRRSRSTPPARRTPAPPRAPSFACRMHAVDGKIMSGVVVATMMRSTSRGAMPAAASACARRVQREVGRLLAVGGDVALRGCRCACGSIRRSSRRASRELVVGEDVRRQIAAGAGDAAMHAARSGAGAVAGAIGRGAGIAAIRCAMLVEHAVRRPRRTPCAAHARTRARRRRRGS